MTTRSYIGRRRLLQGTAAAGGLILAGKPARLWAQSAPAIVTSEKMRPQITSGVQAGDVCDSRALIWSRCDRPARLVVEYATTETLADARRVIGPYALETSDFTARTDLVDLPAGQ
jgi:alkaline phosphatase D